MKQLNIRFRQMNKKAIPKGGIYMRAGQKKVCWLYSVSLCSLYVFCGQCLISGRSG